MIYLTTEQRNKAKILNACAEVKHKGRIVSIDISGERNIVENMFRQGIAILDYTHKKVRKDYPRMFEND